jgi:hypothetical protein
MISFGFEGSFAVNGFEAGTAFRGLTDITGRMETFLLAETEAGAFQGFRGRPLTLVGGAVVVLEILESKEGKTEGQ